MKKILPLLFLLTAVTFQLQAQIPAAGIPPNGYALKGSPVDFTGWERPAGVTSGPSGSADDEIILVENANDIGYIRSMTSKKLFYCDSTDVTFEFKSEPNPNGGTDGFAFYMLTTSTGTPIASPNLGIPLNSVGHAVIFDLYDNDNNNNNPIVGARYFNGNNYSEGSNNGIIGTNRDSAGFTMGAGIWHTVRLRYSFAGPTATNVNLEVFIDGVLRWTGIAFNNLAVPEVKFGFSATNGASNFSKLSIRNVEVKPHPLPPAIYIPTFCTDQAPLAFVYPNGGFAVWYTDATTPNFSVTSPIIDVSTVDSFTYYLGSRVITNSLFCYGDRTEIKIKVHKSPEIDFDFSKIEGCGADTITFTNHSKDADIYNWNFGDGTDTMAFETNHIFNSAGDYIVRLKGQNDFCVDSMSTTIRLENPFTVDFDISKDSICQNGFLEFTNNSKVSDKNNIPTYWKWDFGTAAWDTLITKNPPEKYYYEPGVYNITLTVTNGLPCTDSFTKTVVVDKYPSLDFTRLDTVICAGDNVEFLGTVSTEGLNSLTWDFGDGTPQILNERSITKAYETPGVYTVTANADYRICPDTSFSRQIVVNAIPKINLPKDTTLCYLGNGLEIFDLISNMGGTYLWSTGDTTRKLLVTDPGTYTARVTVNGCSAKDEFTLNRDCYINIPNAFSPDGDGNNDTFIPRNQSEQNIRKFSMQIYNRFGQLIFETKNPGGSGWDGRFNGVEQPFGVYVYTIDVEFNNGMKESYHGNVTLIR